MFFSSPYFWHSILDTRISVQNSSPSLFVKLRQRPLNSETRWTGELWSDTNFFSRQSNKDILFYYHFWGQINIFKIFIFLQQKIHKICCCLTIFSSQNLIHTKKMLKFFFMNLIFLQNFVLPKKNFFGVAGARSTPTYD